jgi:hypothetical protein
LGRRPAADGVDLSEELGQRSGQRSG